MSDLVGRRAHRSTFRLLAVRARSLPACLQLPKKRCHMFEARSLFFSFSHSKGYPTSHVAAHSIQVHALLKFLLSTAMQAAAALHVRNSRIMLS